MRTTPHGSLFPSRPLRKGDTVCVALRGAGVTSREHHRVLRVTKGVAITTDDAYPHYDAVTGEWLGDDLFGFQRWLEADDGLDDEGGIRPDVCQECGDPRCPGEVAP